MSFERKNIVFTEAENALWYPVRTVPLHEMKLFRFFESRGIPAYLPLVPGIRVRSVHHKDSAYRYEDNILRPMLRGYIFAQMDEAQKKQAWQTHSVRSVLDISAYPQQVFIQELQNLQFMENLAFSNKVEYKNEIMVNDRFQIEEPRQFEGMFGYLVERRKRFLWVVKLEILGGFISAEIDPREYKFSKV